MYGALDSGIVCSALSGYLHPPLWLSGRMISALYITSANAQRNSSRSISAPWFILTHDVRVSDRALLIASLRIGAAQLTRDRCNTSCSLRARIQRADVRHSCNMHGAYGTQRTEHRERRWPSARVGHCRRPANLSIRPPHPSAPQYSAAQPDSRTHS